MINKKSRTKGFTIVELLVVIVVIGILASITIATYTGITERAIAASLQSDLSNASKQLKMFQIENGLFPATIDCAQPDSVTNKCIKSSSNATYQYIVNNTSNSPSFSMFITKNNIKYLVTSNSTSSQYVPVVATGGSIADVNGFRVHTFNSSGTFSVTSGSKVEVLVVAGGGGGGSSQSSSGGGGGGGGGGLIYDNSYNISPQSYSVVIGNGGTSGVSGMNQSGMNGENTTFGPLIAIGGGFGARTGTGGGSGGSGGGGGYNGYVTVQMGGLGTINQGNAGGNTALLSWAGGAGGGGAGGIGGVNKVGHGGGDRGIGLTYSISGSPVMYSSGGSGGTNGPASSIANTGKGGDAAYSTGTPYAGGSGVVIVRYPY